MKMVNATNTKWISLCNFIKCVMLNPLNMTSVFMRAFFLSFFVFTKWNRNNAMTFSSFVLLLDMLFHVSVKTPNKRREQIRHLKKYFRNVTTSIKSIPSFRPFRPVLLLPFHKISSWTACRSSFIHSSQRMTHAFVFIINVVTMETMTTNKSMNEQRNWSLQ